MTAVDRAAYDELASYTLIHGDPAFIHQSIVDPNAVIASGYSAGVMPQTFGQQLSPKQIDDLVAFLASGTS